MSDYLTRLTGPADTHLRRLQFLDHEWCKFLSQVRWDAGFEARGFAVVIPLHHLANFVKPRDDSSPVMRHGKFHEFANWAQLTA